MIKLPRLVETTFLNHEYVQVVSWSLLVVEQRFLDPMPAVVDSRSLNLIGDSQR